VTYSALGRDVAQHLVEVHDHFRSEMNQLLDLVEQLRSGLIGGGQARSYIASMTIRQNSWTVGAYCASYCRMLTQHHGMEDSAIFPHLRSSEPGLAPVLDRLAEEHLVIHGILESVDAALVGHLLDPTDVSLIDQAADALARTLLSHLAYEESQLLAPLARYGFYSGQVR
jgi:hemerythrin-like domain-containing protein